MKRGDQHKAIIETLEPRLLLGGSPWALALPVEAESVLGVGAIDSLSTDGTIAQAGEAQVYRFTTAALGRINLKVTAADANFDPLLRVYNSSGRLVYQNDNAHWNTRDSAITFWSAADKTCYIHVSGAKGTVGGYCFSVISTPIDDFGNTLATATRLPTRGGTSLMVGTINYVGDADVLAFAANQTGTMRIQQSRLASWQSLQCDLSAYDAEGNILARSADPSQANAAVSFPVVQGQVYYAKAAGLNNTKGSYLVLVTTTAAPAPAPAPSPPASPASPAAPLATQFTPGAQITATTVQTSAGLELVIVGTNAGDTITLSEAGGGLSLTTPRGTTSLIGKYAAVAIYGFGGDDTIRLTNTVTYSAAIYGGDGDDQIFDAGRGRDAVYGGAGNDLVVTVGGGAATISGGDGLDSLWFDGRDTVADASSAELGAAALHRIDQFFQPTANPANAVPLEIAGQKLVDPETRYAYRDFSQMPLMSDGPQYSDVNQGYLGDCYFLASLASLAETDPMIIRQMIAPMGDGTFAVRFYRNGQAAYVRVDGDLPVSGAFPVYARFSSIGETWVALAEKAYAQFRYGQNSYASIEGGWMGAVLREVTNASTQDVWISGSAAALGQMMSSHLAAGHAVTAATKSSPASPFVGNHAYMVKSVETDGSGTFVTVYNPWGDDGKLWDGNPCDGLMKVSLAQFQGSMAALAVCLA